MGPSATNGKRVILAASATTGTSIPTSPTTTIHRFLNTRNAISIQADLSLTYKGNNIYLPTSFCQDLLQGHMLAIPDPGAPAGPSPSQPLDLPQDPQTSISRKCESKSSFPWDRITYQKKKGVS